MNKELQLQHQIEVSSWMWVGPPTEDGNDTQILTIKESVET